MTLHKLQEGETWVIYWQNQNKQDKAIGLYCQSCCYRHPNDCLFMDTLHPYDRAAETCPDYVPKDFYKGVGHSKCLKKRLEVDPKYTTLPECELFHPIRRPFVLCSSWEFYSIVTKEKAYRIAEKMKEKGGIHGR